MKIVMSSKISYKGKNSHIKKRFSFIEGGHQLEKLEFALAVAQTKGEGRKSEILKKKIFFYRRWSSIRKTRICFSCSSNEG